MLRIVADKNIPQVEAAFSALGTVEVVRSTEITAERVRSADLLLVRSTVQVGPALLSGSRVRFVATATIGTDHLDLPWLAAQGIAVASAPGSNADSVVEWWLCALLKTVDRVDGVRLGIVGVGQVGGRIERVARALGMRVLCCDPPRAEREPGFVSTPIDALLPEVDVVTLHTPLTRDGAHATVKLLDEARLSRLHDGAIVINAARGELVDGAALIAASQQKSLTLLCDVFPMEPAPDPALLAACRLATAHIAGHSLDGKLNGTLAVYRAACAFVGATPTWEPKLPPAQPLAVTLDDTRSVEELLRVMLRLRYDQRADDTALRAITALPDAERAAAWRAFRDNYRERRELRGLRVVGAPPRLTAALRLLGCFLDGEPGSGGANR